MKRVIKTTGDGSKTLYLEDLQEGYHSHHGALAEARHVFIKNGLDRLQNSEIHILELGFGTGLNALVTLEAINHSAKKIHYTTLEKFPVSLAEAEVLNYAALFEDGKFHEYNILLHQSPWAEPTRITDQFSIEKWEMDFFDLQKLTIPPVDLVYFDCFGARVQPELWEEELLAMVVEKMRSGALFTTYASKGSLRRSLEKLGLNVEKLPGPPGKREMINAWKK